MQTIMIDGSRYDSPRELHLALKQMLSLPSYYGMNADALNDCLRACLIFFASSRTFVHYHLVCTPSVNATISSTSARAPLPVVPQARCESFGSMNR